MSSVELDLFILVEGIFDVLLLEKLLSEIGSISSIESYYLVGRGKFIDGARIIEGNNMRIGLFPCGGKSNVKEYLKKFMKDVMVDKAYIIIELVKKPGDPLLEVTLAGNKVLGIIDRNSDDLQKLRESFEGSYQRQGDFIVILKTVNDVDFSIIVADPDLEIILCRRTISGCPNITFSRLFQMLKNMGMDEHHAWRASLFTYCKVFRNQIEGLYNEIKSENKNLGNILDDLKEILKNELLTK